MSTTKQRRKEKKMRGQPSSVIYASRNGRADDPQTGKIPEGGWVRGREPGASVYPRELPKTIPSCYFARARAAEMKAMLKAVNTINSSNFVFGALPNHMRRRAMSHDTKRLPVRLREVAQRLEGKNLQAVKKAKSKSMCRKARRRHGNLLLEFNRRQRKNKWLETHIWHAKRFHMVKKWGYCLGDRPTLKCYRACYRAMSSHCLLQDLSYYFCLELQGPEDQLLGALHRLTNKDAGPTFAALQCLSGRRQGSAVLYEADRFPAQALGPVLFLWRPRTEGSAHRQLWIWGHPTLKEDVLFQLQNVCQCLEAIAPPVVTPMPVPSAQGSKATAPPGDLTQKQALSRKRKRGDDDEDDGQPSKKILGDGTRLPGCPVKWKSTTNAIVLNDLTMEIVRYRLIGPLAHTVLTEALCPATDCQKEAMSGSPSCYWWPQHSSQEANMALHRQQADAFHLLKGVFSSTEIPAGSVLGLTVDDPRINIPGKRTRAEPDLQQALAVDQEKRKALTLNGFSEVCCQSAMWDQDVRDNVTDSKMPEKELNRLRSELLVPGSRLTPTPLQGRVPVLLVHQPGKQVGQEMPCWGTGWDLLLPKGWGMAFWVPLVYRGVRIAGLQMSLKHSQLKGVPHFPHDFPDCPAGARFQEEQETELLDKFTRRPPAKRPNYIKLGCLAPFRCPWQQLVEEWAEIVKETRERSICLREGVMDNNAPIKFTVLRSRKMMRRLATWCKPTSSRGQRLHQHNHKHHQRLQVAPELNADSAASVLTSHGHHCLVWVRVSLPAKGRPTLHAMLCVPTEEDLQLLEKDPLCQGPLEPQHVDHFHKRVKIATKAKRKRRKVEAARAKAAATAAKAAAAASAKTAITSAGVAMQPGVNVDSKSLLTSDPTPVGTLTTPDPTSTSGEAIILTVVQPEGSVAPSDPLPTPSVAPDPAPVPAPCPDEDLLHGLWPEPLPSVTSHCSRLTLGWVTQGGFSLTSGCGEGLGLVSLTGLLHTLQHQPPQHRGILLLRNPHSLQYRFAKVTIEA